MTLADRFWVKVEKSDRCWSWKSKVHRHTGYGVFTINYRDHRAHRVAWELTYGPIPADLWVLHHCDNTICVRPDHLFLGTHQDNMDDAKAKGRIRNHAMRVPPTHCPQGHAYSEYGVRPGKARRLACRLCLNARSRAYQAAERQAPR